MRALAILVTLMLTRSACAEAEPAEPYLPKSALQQVMMHRDSWVRPLPGDQPADPVPKFEIPFHGRTIVVLYTSEGSGLSYQLAYAYECEDLLGYCGLVTTASAGPNVSDELVHTFDPVSGELAFWCEGIKVHWVDVASARASPAQ